MTKARDDLPIEYVCNALSYDPETGLFVWKRRSEKNPQWNGKFAGKAAGTVNDRGYVIICIDYKDFRAHRLAWAIMRGEWPAVEVDHENTIKSDNRWFNLRLANHVDNNRNKHAQSNNTSGYKGVSWSKTMHLWVARIHDGKKYLVLGYRNSADEAAKLYSEAAGKYHAEFAH